MAKLDWVKGDGGSESFKTTSSPFKDGLEFLVTGFTTLKLRKDGVVQDRNHPVFIIKIGNIEENLFVSMMFKQHLTKDDKILTSQGTFVDLVNEVAEQVYGTNDEVMSEVVKRCGNRKVKVTLRPYIRQTQYGPKPGHVVDLNFVG